MKNKIRILWCVIKLLPYFTYCYFFWILRYNKNKDKYPIELRYKRVRNVSLKIAKVLKLDFKVNNIEFLNEEKGRYLCISNHRSSIDPLLYICISERPISFISKVEAKKMPFVGKIINIIDGYFIERDDIMSQVKLFKDVSKHMEETNLPYFVFTEGTRIKERDATHTLPYKDGSLKLAFWSKSDILYVVQFGSQYALKDKKVGFKKRNLIYQFFKPLKYDDFKDKRTVDIMPNIEQESNKTLPLIALENDQRNKK